MRTLLSLTLIVAFSSCQAMQEALDATNQLASKLLPPAPAPALQNAGAAQPAVYPTTYPATTYPATYPAGTAGPVIINGQELAAAQIEELRQQYGVDPVAGRYWYDPATGMFGLEGQAVAGFMMPGHQFGSLLQQASNGSTGVVVNGRQLPQQEVVYLMALFGTPVVPGRYWMDANGNIGLEGTSAPLVNLMQAVQQQALNGAAGDNFWSSRFSAGNSTADGSQGYVSVPGYGPISFGM